MKKFLLCLVFCFYASSSFAENIQIIFGYGPGGANNMIRLLTEDATQSSNLTFVVENQPGANGSIALKKYFQQPPSTKNLLGVTAGQILFEPLINPENNYLTRLKIIGPVIYSPMALAVGPNSKIKTLKDLFDPNIPKQRINVAVAGESHAMLVNLIAKHSPHDIQTIRFKGSSDGYAALLGGHVDMQADVYGYFKTVDNEKIEILGVAQPESLSGVPSLHKYVKEAILFNFFSIAINNKVENTKPIEDAFIRGLVKSNRLSYLQNQGYNVDLNVNQDYLSRVVVPTYKKWKAITELNKSKEKL
jgi:tripartite-type tricarboxylate transporter receptor subunit TctC